MVTEHHATSALLARYRRAYFIVGPLIALPVVLLSVFAFREPGDPWWPVLAADLVVVLIIAFTVRETIRKQLLIQKSLNIIMDEVAITRYQASLEPLTIRLDEVTRVRELPGRWICVYGPGFQRQIIAQAELSDYALLRERIAAVRAPELYVRAGMKRALIIPAIFVPLIGIGVVMRSTDRLVVLICGTLLSLFFVITAALTARSPHVDPRTRRLSWFMLFPLLWLGLKMWSLL